MSNWAANRIASKARLCIHLSIYLPTFLVVYLFYSSYCVSILLVSPSYTGRMDGRILAYYANWANYGLLAEMDRGGGSTLDG